MTLACFDALCSIGGQCKTGCGKEMLKCILQWIFTLAIYEVKVLENFPTYFKFLYLVLLNFGFQIKTFLIAQEIIKE